MNNNDPTEQCLHFITRKFKETNTCKVINEYHRNNALNSVNHQCPRLLNVVVVWIVQFKFVCWTNVFFWCQRFISIQLDKKHLCFVGLYGFRWKHLMAFMSFSIGYRFLYFYFVLIQTMTWYCIQSQFLKGNKQERERGREW